MPGISPKLPLHQDSTDGPYTLNKTFKEATKQNLKNLILTIPGERIMDSFFGVGLYTMLFEMGGVAVQGDIESKIRNQVDFYMPHIEILDILFFDENAPGVSSDHLLSVQVKYKLLPINDDDILEISVE